ncbi:ABC transporter permease [Ruminococcus sp. OA3]|uniref:ABC transporter permease n=1 Tax=Ruminococcus sp. OA3 TaxID=2914164 RepID=UPI001F06CCD8|nr:ABC transporter permease [Ruminococcus sp. OA3]MCH1984518.1 ABC transporter permease [Ruminococcus sp. OA3]
MTLRKAKFWQKLAAGVISFAVLIMIWQLAAMNPTFSQVMPGPFEVLRKFFGSFVEPIGKNVMVYHVLITLSRWAVGFITATVLGIALGLAMGWYPKFESFMRPLFELVRPIPTLAWIPLVILWCGIGEFAKYTLVFIGAFMSIVQNAYHGAKSVDHSIVDAAQMLGCNNRQLFFTIVIPASVPAISAGLQIGVASAWSSVVAAELVRSSSGIGWIVVTGQQNNNMTQILVGILVIAVIGLILALLIRKVEDVLCRWNKRGR